MNTITRWTLAAVTALALVVAPATQAAAVPPVAVWQWVTCTPVGQETVSVTIDNLSATGYRFRIRHWFYEGAVLDRTVTREPWVNAHTAKTYTDPAATTDDGIRTKVMRGHYEYPGGWQTWVTDETLMDVTVDGCS